MLGAVRQHLVETVDLWQHRAVAAVEKRRYPRIERVRQATPFLGRVDGAKEWRQRIDAVLGCLDCAAGGARRRRNILVGRKRWRWCGVAGLRLRIRVAVVVSWRRRNGVASVCGRWF